MVAQRILRGTAATLVHEHLDSIGNAADATGTMTVEVTYADGIVVLPAGTPTTHSDPGRYEVAVPASATAELDILTATWTDTGGSWTTEHYIVGGFLFSIAEALAFENGTLAGFNPATIAAARTIVEDEAERLCGVSFVPRFSRLILNGSGVDTLVAGVTAIRSIVSARTLVSAGSSTYTAFTDTQLDAVVWTSDGELHRSDGNVFVEGFGNIVVELEHGYDGPGVPPIGEDMRNAALTRLRTVLAKDNSAIPDEATSYRSPDGFGYEIDTDEEWSTGIPTVDRVYRRYSLRERPGGQPAPASRPMNLDPQYYGLFRGGVR